MKIRNEIFAFFSPYYWHFDIWKFRLLISFDNLSIHNYSKFHHPIEENEYDWVQDLVDLFHFLVDHDDDLPTIFSIRKKKEFA
jgi:hypothetical protein